MLFVFTGKPFLAKPWKYDLRVLGKRKENQQIRRLNLMEAHRELYRDTQNKTAEEIGTSAKFSRRERFVRLISHLYPVKMSHCKSVYILALLSTQSCGIVASVQQQRNA